MKENEKQIKTDWDKNFMFGHFGNGISICNLKENSRIGHISEAGHLKWYEDANVPVDVIAAAERFAKENEAKYDEKLEKLFAMKEDTPLAKNNKNYFIGRIYEEYLDKLSTEEFLKIKKFDDATMEEKIRNMKEILKAQHKI